MATTTLKVGRQELAKRVGAITPTVEYSTTTAVTTNNYVISTELPGDGYTSDDYFNDLWWILISDGNNAGAIRRITDYTGGSTGVLTVSGAALAAQTGVTKFQLFRLHPTVLKDALNDASRRGWPHLFRPLLDASLFCQPGVRHYPLPSAFSNRPAEQVCQVWLRTPVSIAYSENILLNGGFEDWTGATVDSWTATDMTIAKETDTSAPDNYGVLEGSISVKCTATASTAGDLSQTISTPTTYDGLTFAFSVWVYCTTASRVKARITLNATATDSALHGGTGWELLTVVAKATVALTILKFGILVTSDTTAIIYYVDSAIATAGPLRPPSEDDTPLRGWWVEEQVAATGTFPAAAYLVFPSAPSSGQLLLVGGDYLTQLTTETTTVEIGTPDTELWYALAKRRLAEMMALEGGDTPSAKSQLIQQQAETEIQVSLTQHRMFLPPRIQLPYNLGR